MHKNTKTYLLLTAVLLIWGIIGYKVFSGNSDVTEAEASFKKSPLRSLPTQVKDTFSILTDYRDPFLGTFPKKKVKKTKRTSKLKKTAEPEIKIQFTGLVTDKNSKQRIFFVNINGQQHLMSVKDEIQKVQLLSGTSTSIRVRANGKTRIIDIQE
ncbi:MAG: hypothetical protein ABJN95_05605 [Maribacter sp.]|uniref:hypothetical protein n=1 Tax=Maribacter sp. TaxID=1897614 RepID=UPI00329764FE